MKRSGELLPGLANRSLLKDLSGLSGYVALEAGNLHCGEYGSSDGHCIFALSGQRKMCDRY